MKILVVFTGGTIGSIICDGIADVCAANGNLLVEMYRKSADDDVRLECISPMNILSENSTVQTLSDICSFMLKVDFDSYDGVIVTHGSDTLAYTSALLGLVLSWVKIPVVITASDYVLTLPYSNGLINFTAAVDFIKHNIDNDGNSGVFAVWKNKNETVKAYISTRLNEADGFIDSFSSWGGEPFGIIENGRFQRTESNINPLRTKPCAALEFLKGKTITLSARVLMLNSYPGLDYNAVSLDGRDAVLIKLYHSATACTVGERTSLLNFAKRCAAKNVNIYVYPAKSMKYVYKSSENFDKEKIITLNNIGMCAAYMKLALAYGLEENMRDEVIKNNLFYEELPQ